MNNKVLDTQSDTKDTVREHIEETRRKVTRDYQMKCLLYHCYQKMSSFGEYMTLEMFPSIAYAKDEDELHSLIKEGKKRGLLLAEGNLISVTRKGKGFIDNQGKETMAKPTVFISYNWGSDELANDLETRLIPYADVKRDKTSVRPWGDLTDFMKSIRQQDFAALIISDKYLKSEACLFEVMELMKDEHWDGRVMYVVEKDAHGIYDTAKQLDYIGFWKDKERSLSEEIKKYDPAVVTAQAEELKKVNLIALNIGSFMAKVKRTNNPVVEKAIGEIINRVGGMGSNPPETVTISATDEFEDVIIPLDIDIPDSLREGWNFHGDIAIPLEMDARRAFGERDRPYTKIYDADSIECEQFAEVMIEVLRQKTNHENDREDINEFIRTCSQYIGKSGYDIDHRVS